MGKFYLTREDGGKIGIGTEKPPLVAEVKNERLSRERVLDFITYLRGKGSVAIESRVEISRGFFNLYPHSVYAVAKNEWKTVKGASSSEEVYEKIAARAAKKNSNWQLVPALGYACEEDLIEYLLSLGFPEGEAADLTCCIENRRFKRSAWENDERLSTDFRVWAGASGGELARRDYLPNLFRLEYLEFCHKNTLSADTEFTVSEHSTRGAYNGYGYLTSRLMGESGDGLILGYRDNYHLLDREKLILLSELILRETGMPEMWVRDMNRDTLTVVARKDAAGKRVLPEDGGAAASKVGWVGDFCVSVFLSDNGDPHFHMHNGKTGVRLAVDLSAPGYHRHNGGEKDVLTAETAAALAAWMRRPAESAAELGVTLTNYQNLCLLWNQNSPAHAMKSMPECPDYTQLPTAENGV